MKTQTAWIMGTLLTLATASSDGAWAQLRSASNPCANSGGIYGASKREVCTWITDRNDEIKYTAPKMANACRLADLESFLIEGTALSIGGADFTVRLMAALIPRRIELEIASATSSAPLRAALGDLEKSVQLRPKELRALRALRSRIIEDEVDRIKLRIEVQALLMRISDRLYQLEIQEQKLRIQDGRDGLFSSDEECLASALLIRKDQQMIRSAERILAEYRLLESEVNGNQPGDLQASQVLP